MGEVLEWFIWDAASDDWDKGGGVKNSWSGGKAVLLSAVVELPCSREHLLEKYLRPASKMDRVSVNIPAPNDNP
jgi:hypothetical protein